MMHLDLMYTVQQQRYDDLRAEAAQARARRELVGNPTTWSSTRIATWLRRLSGRRLRGATFTDRVGNSASRRAA